MNQNVKNSLFPLFVWNTVSAARSLTCRDDLDSKWQLLLVENELSRVYLCYLEFLTGINYPSFLLGSKHFRGVH